MEIQAQPQFIRLEFFWWIFTFLVAIGVLFPIYNKAGAAYPFYFSNILFILTFITFTRLLFLLKFSFLANWEKLKIAIICITPILIFYLVNELNYFQTYLDEQGMNHFLPQLSIPAQEAMGKYITAEMLLFGVGSIIAAFVMPFRLIISIWRVRNRGTV